MPNDMEKCATPLMRAIYKRDFETIQKMIALHVDLDKRVCAEGKTALLESIGEGLPEVTKNLILAGADPNLGDGRSVSPLMAAAWYCQADILTLLLSRGAKVNATDADGYTALMNAAYECADGSITAILIRAGANVNLKTKNKNTALTLASFSGNECAVEELVAAGADINAKTAEEETPLTIAKGREVGRKPSHDRICSLLRSLGAH